MKRRSSKIKKRVQKNLKLSEGFRTLSHQILDCANRGLLRVDFLKEVSNIMLNFSKCDIIEMRLKESGEPNRCEILRKTKGSFNFKLIQCNLVKDPDGLDSKRRCMEIILEQFDSSLVSFTEKGSFWCGDILRTISSRSSDDSEVSVYEIKATKNCRSFALIPIVIGKERIGNLQLMSKRMEFFKNDQIELYESFIPTLGLALINQRAQAALRERVKELTCLYGIAQIVEEPEVSLEKIIKHTVNLLPPAWQYPEITHGRIVLNGNVYSTPGFKESHYKQKADIVVNGEKRGFIEVNYAKKKPELDEGPFLKEERHLIDTIAREVALIIERRQTEEDKNKLEIQLRHADRLATIGQLAAGVAHELNEPLGNILGFAQLIKKSSTLRGATVEDIEKIEKASLHAREVIKKLLIFARLMPTKKVNVNLNQIIEDGLYFLESRCAKEGIELVQSLEPNLPSIIGDPAQLTQVLVNLVVNAIQSMPKGGKLTIQTQSTDDYITLSVEDTGIGIKKEILKQIFLPFFTTKEVGQGTGLGLSVVHGIITSHGGIIKVESEIGKGSKFLIEIPKLRDEEED